MSEKPPSAVIIDWDNTVTLATPRVIRNYQRTARHLQQTRYPQIMVPTEEECRDFDKRGQLTFQHFAIDYFGLDPEEFARSYHELCTDDRDLYDELVPGALETSSQLSKRYLLGLLTNSPRRRFEEKAARAGLDVRVFRLRYHEPEIGHFKPDGMVFGPLAGDLASLGYTLSDALYVGDTTGDLAAVRNANMIFGTDMSFVAVTTGSATREDFEAEDLPVGLIVVE